MIYTSYFGNLGKLPENVIPIAICGKVPDWYAGLQYKKLAPKYGFFMEWKKNQDNDFYKEHYNSEVLNLLDASSVVNELYGLIRKHCNVLTCPNVDIALICYEKPDDFCHRTLVADWLNENGYDCMEYTK